MRNILFTLVAFIGMSACLVAQDAKLVEHLQKVSVTVVADSTGEMYKSNSNNSERWIDDIFEMTAIVNQYKNGSLLASATGSGVVVLKDKETFIITAAHVVSHLRSVRKVIKDGKDITLIEFSDPMVYQKVIENGREVGVVKYACKVIKYSDASFGHDMAVLHIYKKSAFTEGVSFAPNDGVMGVGEDILHVGSLLGDLGSNSFTKGYVSAVGRIIEKRTFTQSSAPAFPGSSGGGMFNIKGEYVGCLTRGADATFNFFVPLKRMHEWSKEAKMEWLFSNDATMPNLAEIKVED